MSKFSYFVRYDYKKFGQPFRKLWVWAKPTILSANKIFLYPNSLLFGGLNETAKNY